MSRRRSILVRPVTATAFFDRASELARLQQAVESLRKGSPQWVAVLGSRKVGKTSLLLELMRREHREDTAFAVLDTFEDGPPSAELFRRLALRVVDAFFARELGASLESLSARPDEYKATLVESKSCAKLPRELRTLLLGLPEVRADMRLAELALRLGERLATALDRHCVVAWDEFQALARLKLRAAGDALRLARAVWQKHQRTAYFVCGSERTMLRDLVSRVKSERSPCSRTM
ncbi:MAG: ATP-binding protein [Deltaproteobacteria bacterium]|nr:ATP-binding protein [Deltaproteobacteria bacterium]